MLSKKYLIIFVAFLVGLIGLIIIYSKVGVKDTLIQLQRLHFWQLGIVVGTSIAMISLTIYRWGLILIDSNQKKLSWKSIIKARLGDLAFSYLTPIMYFGGGWVRAYVMNKEQEVSINLGLASVFLDRLAEIASACLFIFAGAVLLVATRSFVWGILMLIIAIIIFLGLYLAVVLIGLDRILSFLVNFLRLNKIPYCSKNAGQTTLGERFVFLGSQVDFYFRQSRLKFLFSVFVSFLVLVIWLWQTKLIVGFLGFHLPWTKIFIIKIFITISMFMPISANLGSYEGAHLLAFKLFGLPSDSAMALSVINRALDLIWITAGVILISRFLATFVTRIPQIISNLFSRHEQPSS